MKQSRKILKNMFSLTVAEIANKGIVFITTAYLARILLPDGFGIIGFANSFSLYFLLFVHLGFNVIGTREVAKNPSDIKKYVNNIVTLRLLIAIFIFIIYSGTVYFIDKPLIVKYVLWLAGLNFFSNAFLLDWVYQGLEKMEVIALRQVVTAVLNLVGVLVFVHSTDDVAIAMLIMVSSVLINAVWMLLLYIKLYGKISFKLDFSLLKTLLKSSLQVAFYHFFANVLNTINIVLLGIFWDDAETGLYYSAYRIMLLTIVPSYIIQGAFFPMLSRAETIEERRKVLEKYTLLMFILSAIITFSFFTFSDYITIFVYGEDYADSSILLKLLMFTSFIVFINTALTPPLIAWHKEKSVMIAIGVASFVSIVSNLILIPMYKAEGAAYATIISEFVVAVLLIIILYRIVKKIYLLSLLKTSLFAGVSCLVGYYFYSNGLNAIFSGSLTIIIYILINFALKTVTISEIKGYLKK